MAVLKNGFLQSFRGKSYYYKVDTETKTISFYEAPTNADYKNDTGSLIFTEKISSLQSTSASGSSKTITNANDALIKSYGRNFLKQVTKTALSNIEKSADLPISRALGIENSDNREQVEAASDGNATPETDNTVAPSEQPAPGVIERSDEFIQKLAEDNRRGAQDFEITTANLPSVTTSVGGSLKYPIDLDTRVQDTLQISIFQYQAARRLPGLGSDVGDGVYGATDADRELGGPRFLRTESLRSDKSRRQKLYSVITLPIPNSVADSNAVQWGGGEFSSVAGTLGSSLVDGLLKGLGERPGEIKAGAFESLADALNTLSGQVQGSISAAKEILGNEYVQRKKILEVLAKGAGALGVNVDVTQVITRVGGVVENPNLELLFTGPSLRSFTFQVRLTPRSVEESKVVRRIIRAFKQHSAVKKGAKLGTAFDANNLLLGTPDVFVLKYIQAGTKQEIKGVTKMKTCALTNISVDYTGGVGRWAAYDGDSQPMTSIMTLNFAELAPIYDTDYQSFDVEDVGF
jgi:hypothetical protein